jgi:hypothetical protein
VLTGELGGRPAELFLFDVAKFDHNGPVFVRAHERAPGLHVVALLQSDSSGTRERFRSDNYLGRSATIILAGRVARQRRL